MPSSTAPWDQPRKSTTVTVEVPNPTEATHAELLATLADDRSGGPLIELQVEYVNSRRLNFGKPGGHVCFCISWRNPSWLKEATDA